LYREAGGGGGVCEEGGGVKGVLKNSLLVFEKNLEWLIGQVNFSILWLVAVISDAFIRYL
jgi:hypothetical protein